MKARRPGLILLAAAAAAYLLIWPVLANPLNLFVPRSERFSFSLFQTIKPGASIADAIKLLGAPVKIVKENRFDPSCRDCIAYCFLGDPPDWVIGFREAWLIADRQGRIRRTFINSEP